jgi:hypothetical protein
MATLAQFGAANTSCYGDATGTQYPMSELGNMNGSCEGVLSGCGRLKGFRYIDLTPKGIRRRMLLFWSTFASTMQWQRVYRCVWSGEL